VLEIQRLACAIVEAALGGRNLNQALADTWRRNSHLKPSERAAIQDLSFGALRFYGLLDSILNSLLVKPVTDASLRVLLIVTLYQLQYTRAKPFAIVDHAVQTAVALGKPAAKGLTNAVLRNFLRRREALVAEAEKAETARLNHPTWWIAKLKKEYPEHWEAMLSVANQPPPMTLRVNRRLTSVSSYLDLLASHDIGAQRIGGQAVLLTHPMPVDRLPGFAEGLVSIQDVSAQHAGPLLDIAPGMRVLDACSAPGGKTCHLLEIADVDVVALDSDAERLRRVADNLNRLKFTASLIAADAGAIDSWWDGKPFDRILIDAPCTGSGVTRRHPDIKWARRRSDIAQFAAQQKRLLETLWPTLRLGGKLLYATCSVFREENHGQVADFLSYRRDAHNLPLTDLTTIDGQIVPNEFHDGFFYALLEKV